MAIIWEPVSVQDPPLSCTLFVCVQVSVHLSEEKEGIERKRLLLVVAALTSDVKLRSWDMKVDASVGSFIVEDHYHLGEP